MLRCALALAAKDLRLMLAGGQGVVQAILLGLLLIFVFSLSLPPGQPMSPQGAAAVFWLSTTFGLVLIANGLYALEETHLARVGLALSPMPLAGVWLGKGLAALVLLLVAQLAFVPATVAFLGQKLQGPLGLGAAGILAADWGLAALASLLGALAGGGGRESLLSVLLFPVLVPVLLAAISLTTASLSPVMAGAEPPVRWLGLLGAYDGVFTGVGLILFPFVFGGEE